LLNILKITEPIYLGVYLYTKLVEVTDRLGITYVIILVTRDNTKLNNSMLNNLKVVV
jgi:MinD superfamily P-loop ATPase